MTGLATMMSPTTTGHASRARGTRRLLLALTLLTLALGAIAAPRAQASFGVQSVEVAATNENGAPDTQAGSHPYALTINLALARKPLSQRQREAGLGDPGPLGEEITEGDVRDIESTLPAGVMVDLLGVPRCPEQQLARQRCQAASQVGTVTLDTPFALLSSVGATPVFNIAISSPSEAGAIGFTVGGVGFIAHLVGSDHAGGDYGISALVSGIPQVADADGLTLTLWGDPSAASHCHQTVTGGPCVAVPEVSEAFLTLPTSCPAEATPTEVAEASMSASADSWQEPGIWTSPIDSAPLPPQSGCEHLSFTPSIAVQPETETADEPTGITIALRLPHNESSHSLSEASMREAVFMLPTALAVSPSAVSGLSTCSEAQVGLDSPAPAACPPASKLGSVQAGTPLLDHPVYGSVYLAEQGNAGPGQGANPFGSLIAMYVIIEGAGVDVKIAGEVSLNETTGQITARFPNLPQIPYSELLIHFFGGPRAALVPRDCGSLSTTSVLTPWSAPQSGAPARPQSTFTVSSGCPSGAFSPRLIAGTSSNQAGSYSPIVETFARGDGEQELYAAQERLPEGLLGSLVGVPLCPEPQARRGACGAESLIGEVNVAAGPGPDPVHVSGKVYFTGPYDGAPFGASVVVPAKAGPFDLGTVVVQVAISVDPRTAQAIATVPGPLPLIFAGVPLQIKQVTLTIDRPNFIYNPTSCAPASFTAPITGSLGAVVTDTLRYQASGCAALKFEPRFALRTTGVPNRKDGIGVAAKLTMPAAPKAGASGAGATAAGGAPGTAAGGAGGPDAASGSATNGQANFAKVRVELPRQLSARLTTIQRACPASVFEDNPAACPSASRVATVKATTPILPVPLIGPAYFVSYGGTKFPELVIVLEGYGVTAQLHGETFIAKGVTSVTFPAIPDVPVSSFELYLPPGPYSALAGNGHLCKERFTMPVVFVAQNGHEVRERIKVGVGDCGKPSAKRATKPRKHTKPRNPRKHRQRGRG